MLFFCVYPTFSYNRISCDTFSRTSVEEKGEESRRRLAGEGRKIKGRKQQIELGDILVIMMVQVLVE